MLAQLLVSIVEEAIYGRFFQGTIHTFNLSVCPGMIRFCQSMLDPMLITNTVKQQLECVFVTCAIGKLDAVIGKYGVYFVWNCIYHRHSEGTLFKSVEFKHGIA